MIAELRQNLYGVLALMSFREDWRSYFDVSERGFRRSFMAVLWAVPFFILALVIQRELVLGLAADPATARTAGPGYALILYAMLWAYFPLIAWFFTGAFQLRESFAPWVIVHNWTVLFLLILSAVIGLPFLAGLVSAEAYYSTASLYFMFGVFAHCRVAIGSLNTGWSLAVGGACLTVILWQMAQVILAYTLSGSAVQA